ncbi:MAG TPA: CorA family divalent cation transporter [Methanocella sp.]|nr:CorA family divalent cation transporter [Methanocella sp.]
MDNQIIQAVPAVAKKVTTLCVLLKPDGQVERFADRPLEECLKLVEGECVAWIDYSTQDLAKDLDKVAATAGLSQLPVPKLLAGFFSAYEDADTELGITLPAVHVKDLDVIVRPLVILMKGNLIMTVHDEDMNRLMKFARYAPTFMKKIRVEVPVDKITMILERILEENNDRNFEYLREIEKHGDDISRRLIDEHLDKRVVAQEIYLMKHALITYLNVLWATKDVIDSLRYGDADLMTDDEKLLVRIGILSDNIDRHIELSEQMSNVLASGLEVMQSIYNNQLQTMNNRFALVTAYLTVLGTAALVPNTLATIAGSGYEIWGQSISDFWWYMPMLIVATIAATLLSLWWVLRVWRSRKDDDLVAR